MTDEVPNLNVQTYEDLSRILVMKIPLNSCANDFILEKLDNELNHLLGYVYEKDDEKLYIYVMHKFITEKYYQKYPDEYKKYVLTLLYNKNYDDIFNRLKTSLYPAEFTLEILEVIDGHFDKRVISSFINESNIDQQTKSKILWLHQKYRTNIDNKKEGLDNKRRLLQERIQKLDNEIDKIDKIISRSRRNVLKIFFLIILLFICIIISSLPQIPVKVPDYSAILAISIIVLIYDRSFPPQKFRVVNDPRKLSISIKKLQDKINERIVKIEEKKMLCLDFDNLSIQIRNVEMEYKPWKEIMEGSRISEPSDNNN